LTSSYLLIKRESLPKINKKIEILIYRRFRISVIR